MTERRMKTAMRKRKKPHIRTGIGWKGAGLFLLIAVLIGGAALTAGTVSAYFTSESGLNNRFTVGVNTSVIEESFDPVPDKGVYKKAVQVMNTGSVPCYVRVYLAFSDGDIGQNAMISPDGKSYYPAVSYAEHLPEGWVNGEDGYYYYTEAVKPGEKTGFLMKNVKVVFGPMEEKKPFDLIVREESVQVSGNTTDSACFEAFRAFEERAGGDNG